MNILMLVPSFRKTDIEADVRSSQHPMMDYDALEQSLLRDAGAAVTFVDFSVLDACQDWRVRLATAIAGKDVGLAVLAMLRYAATSDCIFSNSESVSIPFALLTRFRGKASRRPAHVTIAHRLSTKKKQVFFKTLALHRELDHIFVYASVQYRHAIDVLGIPADKLSHIQFHADTNFYREQEDVPEVPCRVSAAGLEWRDYQTLIAAAERLPALEFRIAAASPWSKHANETDRKVLPANVTAQPYTYKALRELYASSSVVAVPLYETDFQAGITSLLEAMAMKKTIIVSRTSGQCDVIIDGKTGIYVDVGDVDGWIGVLERLISDSQLRDSLASHAQTWVQEHGSLRLWVYEISSVIIKVSKQSLGLHANFSLENGRR